jgi:hypothetical protein
MCGVLPAASHCTPTKVLTALYLAGTGWMGTFLGFGGHGSNPFGQKSSATQADVKNYCRVLADRKVAPAASNRTLAIETRAQENTNQTIPRVMCARTLLQSRVRRLWYARQVRFRIRRR